MTSIFAAESVTAAFFATAGESALAQHPALIFESGAITYPQLAQNVASFAHAVASAGITHGDAIGILAGRGPESVIALLASMHAGCVSCILEERLPPAELALRISSAHIRLIIADVAHQAAAAVAVDLLHDRQPEVALFDELQSNAPQSARLPRLEDDALMLFTSGSTSSPKAVPLTHRNVLTNSAGIVERTGITAADRLLHVMPLYHTNGVNNQLLAPLIAGATIIFRNRFNADRFFDEVAGLEPTYITGVPTIFSRLLDKPVPTGALATLRFARCGSAPLSSALHRQIEEHLQVPLVVSYGLSEATCTSTMNPPDARRIGSVGTALERQHVAILSPEGAQPLAPGIDGEICIGGPAVMRGYLDADDAADGPRLEQGWLRTGDLGRLDADGYLTVSGRLKDVIIRGGENLSPARIEAALLSDPGVKACCVVGAPDDDLGEVPVAFVVAQTGVHIDERGLTRSAESLLPHACVPHRVVILDSLPEIGVGKIDRKALKAQAART